MTIRRLSIPLLAIAVTVAAPLTGQDRPIGFVATDPLVRLAVTDLPALLEALPGTALGRLFAEPDVAAAIALGQREYAKRIARWVQIAKEAEDAGVLTAGEVVELAVMGLDWRDFRSAALLTGNWPEGAEAPVAPTFVLLEPRTGPEGRLAQAFEALAARCDKVGSVKRAAEQKIDGHPAHVFETGEVAADAVRSAFAAEGLWLLHLPGQFAGGQGSPGKLGRCAALPAASPGIELQFDLASYLKMFARFGLGGDATLALLDTLGLDAIAALHWRVRFAGERLQDEIALRLRERPSGLLAALLEGMAPLPDQPLPDGALLQLRFAIDVPRALQTVDELLAQNDLPSLKQLQLTDELRKAVTGGVSFAVCRPAPGGVVPRLYLSIGIADQDAAKRLLARLTAVEALRSKDVELEASPCTQLHLEGLPPALQPTFCLREGIVHLAESGISLRALLKAIAAKGAPALDVGAAPLPPGDGPAQPSFDLRFDGAAIYRAVHEVWQPLWTTTVQLAHDERRKALVAPDDMPDADVVARHLTAGRGVLRRQRGADGERVALCMSGTAGGPELHGLLAAYGPMFSGPMTWSWQWASEELARRVARGRLQQVHAALEAFQKRTGKRPAALAELFAAGDLKDSAALRIPGDEAPQPILGADGKELATSSFRYYPDGLRVSPEGEELTALLIETKPRGYGRLVLDDGGIVHEAWGELANQPLDQVEKNAPKK